ncbi:MAG: sigma-54 dependent transcriptional regulator [Acidobacteriota bacterium]
MATASSNWWMAGSATIEREKSRVLIADDQEDVREALRLMLKGEGFAAHFARSPREVLAALEEREFDVLLMDLNYTRDTTSGREGLELLEEIQSLAPHLAVVVMTAWGTVELAVEAMRRGARDFVEKPWDNARLVSILRTQAKLSRALLRERRLRAENRRLSGTDSGPPALVAESPAMAQVLELMSRCGPTDAPLLLTGENGTGKSLIARHLHETSPRKSGSYLAVNAGALPEGTFESELFGHVKGAFTDARSERIGRFEAADGGTLFLDEIANVPVAQQAKLLRVVESGELERVGSSRTRTVDVRLISATNSDLDREVDEGRFRRDLLYRLNTIIIHLPPLRDRDEDIRLLAELFLQRHRQRYRRPVVGFGEDAVAALHRHAWPGNVRELDHAVERAVLMAAAEQIHARDLGLQESGDGELPGFESMTLEEAERWLIERAMRRHGGSVKAAAEQLGLSRGALYRRLERYGL